jgi:MOSC domain-containing protein YiiM
MKLLSVNIGQPKKVSWQGKDVITSIFKEPTLEKQELRFNSLANDTQSDKRYHGGWDKAVYSYDQSYYEYWNNVLNRDDLLPGMFGENLTTEGMPDHLIYAGDVFEVGTCIVQAIQPRFPCARLNLRFNDRSMVKQFAASKRHGIYYKVLKEGYIQAGDAFIIKQKSEIAIRIDDIVNCYYNKAQNERVIGAIVQNDFFPDSLKKDLQ